MKLIAEQKQEATSIKRERGDGYRQQYIRRRIQTIWIDRSYRQSTNTASQKQSPLENFSRFVGRFNATVCPSHANHFSNQLSYVNTKTVDGVNVYVLCTSRYMSYPNILISIRLHCCCCCYWMLPVSAMLSLHCTLGVRSNGNERKWMERKINITI